MLLMLFTLLIIWWYAIVLVLEIADKVEEEPPVKGVKIDHKYYAAVTNQNTELTPEEGWAITSRT